MILQILMNTLIVFLLNLKGEKLHINSNGGLGDCWLGCDGSVGFMNYFHTYTKNNNIGFTSCKRIKTKTGKDSIINSLTLAIWDDFIENNYRLAGVLKDGKWGVINLKNEVIIGYIYDDLTVSPNEDLGGQFKVKLNTKWGLLDRFGNVVIAPKYYKIDYFRGNYAKAWITETFWFYIDKDGKEYYE